MAIAGRWMAAHFNRPGFEDLIDFNVYALCGDGCMMEGISRRGRLARRPPGSSRTSAGSTTTTTSPSRATPRWPSARTSPRGSSATAGTSPASATPTTWRCSTRAFQTFQSTRDRPTLIIVDSHIAYGAPNKQDTSAAHGEPLGEEEIRLTKRYYGWPEDAKFLVPDGVYEHFKDGIGKRGKELRDAWFAKRRGVQGEVPRPGRPALPDAAPPAARRLGQGPADVPGRRKGMATRDSSGKVLNAIAKNVPG